MYYMSEGGSTRDKLYNSRSQYLQVARLRTYLPLPRIHMCPDPRKSIVTPRSPLGPQSPSATPERCPTLLRRC
ncbi:hypothetical protein C8Q78DRAFT_1046760 [Trametes maxima]|nr:hypothetical protein C8Q78DRAFT_1046760 [Trametes maxima]